MKKQKRKNLKSNITNLYIALALVFVFCFGFFGTSKLFLAEEIPINQTELRKEFDLRSEGKFSINSWIYDPDNNMMEITLVTNGMEDYSSKLDFSAIAKVDLKNELPLEVVYNDNDIFIVHIKNVPKNFQQVAVRLHKTNTDISTVFDETGIEEEQNEDSETVTVSSIYTDERVVEKAEIIEKDVNSYALQVTDKLIQQTIEEKKVIQKNIGKIDTLNSQLNEEISKLKTEVLYQTVEEQVDTNEQIYNLERDIEINNKEKQTMLDNIKSLESKIERLEQRKIDIGL